jgi:hypothetical protein
MTGPTIADNIPSSVANAFIAARDTSLKLQAADTLVTKLTTDLAAANADEASLKISARDTLKAAESSFDDFVTSLRANLEAFVAAPAEETGGQSSGDQPAGDQPAIQPVKTDEQDGGAPPVETNQVAPEAQIPADQSIDPAGIAGTDPNAQ